MLFLYYLCGCIHKHTCLFLSSHPRLSGFDRKSFQYMCHRIDCENELCFALCRIMGTCFATEHMDLPSTGGSFMSHVEIAFPSVKLAQPPEA